MTSILFDENGVLKIDEAVAQNANFKKIMEDGVVTEEELSEQGMVTAELFKKVEELCSNEQLELIKSLLVETSVLNAIYNYHQLQTLKF